MIKSVCIIGLFVLMIIGGANVYAAPTDLFKPATERFIGGYAIPIYTKLKTQSDLMDGAISALCATPSETSLNIAKESFSDLLVSWAGAELIRFGPVRAENRMERIFFWPDPRGRGLKQVQKLLYHTQQSSADATSMALEGKSVAVQGLSALEFILFSKDASVFLSRVTNRGRCVYAKAITANLAEIAFDILRDWQGNESFAKIMRNPGADNQIYRTNAEAFREVLKSVSEALIITQQAKLNVVLGASAEKSAPRKAPFWRSGNTLIYIQAILQNVVHLNTAVQFAAMLDGDENGSVKQLDFELGQVIETFAKLKSNPMSWAALVTSTEGYGQLAYVGIPMNSVQEFYSETFPEQLGLSMGFNSLDGD